MNLTIDDVKRMLAYDLRTELVARGLDSRGKKAVLQERLVAALALGDNGPPVGSSETISTLKVTDDVQQMTWAELRSALVARGLKSHGVKAVLQERLSAALAADNSVQATAESEESTQGTSTSSSIDQQLSSSKMTVSSQNKGGSASDTVTQIASNHEKAKGTKNAIKVDKAGEPNKREVNGVNGDTEGTKDKPEEPTATNSIVNHRSMDGSSPETVVLRNSADDGGISKEKEDDKNLRNLAKVMVSMGIEPEDMHNMMKESQLELREYKANKKSLKRTNRTIVNLLKVQRYEIERQKFLQDTSRDVTLETLIIKREIKKLEMVIKIQKERKDDLVNRGRDANFLIQNEKERLLKRALEPSEMNTELLRETADFLKKTATAKELEIKKIQSQINDIEKTKNQLEQELTQLKLARL